MTDPRSNRGEALAIRGEIVFEHHTQMQPIMASARAGAKARKEEQRSGQLTLTGMSHPSPRLDALRRRYHERARSNAWKLLTLKRDVAYDDLWIEALAYPLVSEADLKNWIKEWKVEGHIDILGLTPRERVPKCEKGHRIKVLA